MNNDQWIESFSYNLRALMREANITQEELSIKSGISKSAISRYINMLQFPTHKAILNLSYALECTTDELIDYGEPID